MKLGQVRIGTSGWIYRHWRGTFYPPDLPVPRWFAYYAHHFDTVEINNTFYRLPSEDAFDAWKRQAPSGFVYAVKASRYLTHQKKLKDAEQPLENILGRARRLGFRHLGPILYQLPPHWHADPGRLRAFLSLLPRDLRHVFEFRDPSWCNDTIRSLLTEAGVGYCIHDMRGFDCADWVTGRVVYVRFHGPTAKYAGKYGTAHLRAWAERIRAFQESGHDVFVYFNNDDRGHAVTNARELRYLLDVVPVSSSPPRGTN